MGINRIPSVNIYIRDKSDLPNLGAVTNIVGLLLDGERGFEELINLDRRRFYKYFTSISKAVDKLSYVGAGIILEEASEVIIGALSKNAKYGGVYITDRGTIPFNFGVSSLKSFDFYPVREISLSNFVGNTVSGTIDLTKGIVKVGSARLEYVLSGETKIINVSNEWTIVDSNISNFSFDNNTGEYSITFVVKPDDSIVKFIYNSYSDIYSGKLNKIDVTDNNVLTYSFDINDNNIKLDSVYVYYTIAGIEYVGKSNSNGVITGDNIDTGSVVKNGNKYTVNLTFTNGLDVGSKIYCSYVIIIKYLASIIAKGNKKWSNDYGYKIEEIDTTFNIITIGEYKKESDGSNTLLNTYDISLSKDGVNKYGRNAYLENVFETSDYGIGFVNDDVEISLPIVDQNVVYMAGGDDGDTATDTEKVNMLNLFYNDKIYFNFFCGNGITSKTVLDKIGDLVNYKNKQAYLDVLDSNNVDNIVQWANNNISDNMRCFWYSPFAYVSFEGSVYYCSMSALAVRAQCRLVNQGKRFMSPSGVGNGSLNVVKLVNYFTKEDQLKLSKVNINVARYFKEFGVVIFDNQTGQKKFSGTSFINSVLTLNDMIENLENILPSLQLNRVINDELFILLRQLIESYLKILELEEGTIEPSYSPYGWKVNIENLNNEITRDNKEVNCEIIFSFQSVLRTVNLYLTYTSNQLIVKYK